MKSWSRTVVFSTLLTLLLASVYSPHYASATQSHPVTTFIDAKWSVTPVALEVSEFLADENPDFYWKFIDELNQLRPALYRLDSDSKQYQTVLKLAKKFLGNSQTDLLKLSLALRSLSPRIQAHLQIARDVLENAPSCEAAAFVVIGGKVICSFADVEPEISRRFEASENQKANHDNAQQQFNFDQVFPGSESHPVTVVLYNEIGSESSRQFHDLLREKAENGVIKFINRHYVQKQSTQKVRLSGYGVEMHMKSTEYKSQDDSPKPAEDDTSVDAQDSGEPEINGFDFAVLKRRHPNLETFLDRYRRQMQEKTTEIEPLKAWQFQELGLQAAYQIASIQGDDSLRILQHLSQNFPMQAKTLLNVVVDESFKEEMKHNIEVLGRNLNLQPPDGALFINGLFFDADTLDTESLLDTLCNEQRSMAALHNVGIPSSISKPLLTLDLGTANKEFALDIRDSAIQWVNDIEQDAVYKRWPSSVFELLRPTFPGMLRSLRKNMFNLVFIMDPVKGAGRHLLKLADSFVQHSAPVRVGLVMDFRAEDPDSKAAYDAILYAFNYIYQNKNGRDALSLLNEIYSTIGSDEKPVKRENVRAALKRASSLSADQLDDILGPDSDYDYGRQLSHEFVDRLGQSSSPTVLMNGVPISDSLLGADDFEEAVLQEVVQQTPVLQKAVYKGELSDTDNILDYLMDQSHVMPRLHPMILNSADSVYIDLSGKEFKDLANVKALASLPNSDMSATLMPNLKYLYPRNSFDKLAGSQVHFVTVWVAADLNTSTGRKTLLNALQFVKATKGARVAFLPNTEASVVVPRENLNNLVWSAVQEKGADVLEAVIKALDSDDLSELQKLAANVLSASSLHLKMIRVYCQRVLKLRNQESGAVLNGRLLGPLKDAESFSVADFGLMERFVNFQYGEKIRKVMADPNLQGDVTSDQWVKLISILVPRENTKNRFTIPGELKDEQSVLRLPPKRDDEPYFDVVAVLDPASRAAQKLSPMLNMLRTVLNSDMKVFLCAVDKHSDLPVKNFYRFVVDTELRFDKEGKMEKGPIAKFTGLPASSLLTQTLAIPDNWMVEIVNSVYDLDNIRLSEINGPVHSNYELEHLILEGHCFDASTGSPPRGLQFTLGTKNNPLMVDTIVMSNLGYFQLKANPGAWILRLRQGKSAEIYDMNSVEGKNAVKEGEESVIVLSSLKSNVVKVKVGRKPDQQNADLLADDKESASGIWDSIKNTVTGSGGEDEDGDGEVINIFSVASGHMYERLLRIMMLSTLKNTKTPVKFWFLKNYLSPQFIDFLPHMAKEYNFQFELVQYKWPRWLNQQTEKQRIIWGYKILFLDVLFPLGVKKIIFVDADAIVRGDLKELNNMDLGGAPYAYTPFCDSRKDMEGFRFWKQGYWRNHLQGRKYHISALYVVDLKRFRKIAAGDRLRGQYQALSQDPNSLSNLDQDLPNNMIHQVQLKSLPPEWLYCATWCSPEDIKQAKVIDLCNNPQTKEAKLTAALRIAPEWPELDQEIKRLMVRVDSEMHEHSPRQPEASSKDKDEL